MVGGSRRLINMRLERKFPNTILLGAPGTHVLLEENEWVAAFSCRQVGEPEGTFMKWSEVDLDTRCHRRSCRTFARTKDLEP